MVWIVSNQIELTTQQHQFFKLYKLYCNNYEQALLKVEQAKKRSNVAAFLKVGEPKSPSDAQKKKKAIRAQWIIPNQFAHHTRSENSTLSSVTQGKYQAANMD